MLIVVGLVLMFVAVVVASSVGGNEKRAQKVGSGGQGVRGGGDGSDLPVVNAEGSQVHVEDAEQKIPPQQQPQSYQQPQPCADDPDHIIDLGNSQNCGDWLSGVGGMILESRCQLVESTGLRVKDYCRKSCDNCPSAAVTTAQPPEQDFQVQLQTKPSILDSPPPLETTGCADDPTFTLYHDGMQKDCADWIAMVGRPTLLEHRCQLVQSSGLRIKDYCKKSCGNCPPESAGPAPQQVASTATAVNTGPATPVQPLPEQGSQTQTKLSLLPRSPPLETTGCADDPTFTFYPAHKDQLKDCADWVAHVGRPTLLEHKCQEPVGTRADNGVEVRLRDYCRKSCRLCT